MSISCGFYNSFNNDRLYYASDFSKMFDGLIIDGVFASIGTAFSVKAAGGLIVNIGTGKAWFNRTWTINDSIMPMTAPDSDVLLDRIDAIVLEINSSEPVRDNTIKFITGTPASTPVRPTLENEGEVHQYPLCYIYRKCGSSEISQSDITSMIGSESTPFVTGILQTISLDELLGQWQDELDQFIANNTKDFNDWMDSEKSTYIAWFNQMKSDLQSEQALLDKWIETEKSDLRTWIELEQSDFLNWYHQMKDQLTEDAAGNLQSSINKEEIKRILLVGFEDGDKEFSKDGTVITSTSTDGRTLTKTFTNGFLTITTVLKSAVGLEIARAVKNFDPDGKLVSTIVTYS